MTRDIHRLMQDTDNQDLVVGFFKQDEMTVDASLEEVRSTRIHRLNVCLTRENLIDPSANRADVSPGLFDPPTVGSEVGDVFQIRAGSARIADGLHAVFAAAAARRSSASQSISSMNPLA